jgi:hypothetical protein
MMVLKVAPALRLVSITIVHGLFVPNGPQSPLQPSNWPGRGEGNAFRRTVRPKGTCLWHVPEEQTKPPGTSVSTKPGPVMSMLNVRVSTSKPTGNFKALLEEP